MAENIATTDFNSDINSMETDKKLQDIFLEGWKAYETLEETNLAFNSAEYQNLVKTAMENFENATRAVSQFNIFSPNELIDEVSTESLQYLLLPFFLGKLALKLQREDRIEVLNVAEIYFNDFLQRCQEYELCDNANKSVDQTSKTNEDRAPPQNELAELMQAAHSRNNKIAQFRRKKELEEQIKLMKTAVLSKTVDDEVRRTFFINFIKKSIIEAQEELESLKMEKQMLEMRKLHMKGTQNINEYEEATANPEIPSFAYNHGHGHSHSHPHKHHYDHARPQPKPLQPFIITRNDTQRAVFGAGYPSLPVLTVDEFYTQRVAEGIFPDEEKVKKMNEAQAIAAAQDPNEKEDEEKAVIEEQIENDDPEYLARMRRMDEYKDVVRRGDGNRHNRS